MKHYLNSCSVVPKCLLLLYRVLPMEVPLLLIAHLPGNCGIKSLYKQIFSAIQLQGRQCI